MVQAATLAGVPAELLHMAAARPHWSIVIQDRQLDKRALLKLQVQQIIQSVQHRRWAWFFSIILSSIVFIFFGVALWQDWRALDLRAFQFRYGMLAVSWLAHGGGTLLGIWTWAWLMRQMGYAIPFKRHIKVYTRSTLARRLPGFVWWIAGRAYMYDRNGVSKLDTSAGAMLEMLITTAAALGVAILTAGFSSGAERSISVPILLALFGVCAGLLHPRLFELVRRRIPRAQPPRRVAWSQLLLLFGCEMAVIALGGLALYFMLAAIYQVESTALAGAMQGWALTIVSGTILFWLPFDFGLSSGLLALALSIFIPMPAALVVTVAWRCWTGLCELIWGLLGLAVRSE